MPRILNFIGFVLKSPFYFTPIKLRSRTAPYKDRWLDFKIVKRCLATSRFRRLVNTSRLQLTRSLSYYFTPIKLRSRTAPLSAEEAMAAYAWRALLTTRSRETGCPYRPLGPIAKENLRLVLALAKTTG